MAKEIDSYIGGVVKKVKKVPVCIGGVVKEAKKGFCGVGGAVKEFFRSAEFEFDFYDDNDGLAVVWVEDMNTNYPELHLNTGKINSSASLRIYGDFVGKTISVNGTRDTDGSGGVSFYRSDGTYFNGIGFTDDLADGPHTFGPFEDCAYMTLNVSRATSTKSRSVTLRRLIIDGENKMFELTANAAELGWTDSPFY